MNKPQNITSERIEKLRAENAALRSNLEQANDILQGYEALTNEISETNKENAALRADNAALVGSSKEYIYAMSDSKVGITVEIKAKQWLLEVLNNPHPGATLLKELEELRSKVERYEQPNLKCGRGHKNNLPLALWDCPMCTEGLRTELERLQNAIRATCQERCHMIHCTKSCPFYAARETLELSESLVQVKAGEPHEPVGRT